MLRCTGRTPRLINGILREVIGSLTLRFNEGAEENTSIEVDKMAEDKDCGDKKCWKHGSVKVRGDRVTGRIVSTKGKNTAVVERAITKKLTKYQRWAKEKSRISAHNPPCIDARVGDMVEIGETRKLSKTKAWTVLGVIEAASE